jgi:hypothetical protein
MNEESESLSTRCEVELDIFSGRANPTWLLTNEETARFLRTIAALPAASPRELSGNLGYRGFMVQCTEGADSRLIRIQKGIVQLTSGADNAYAIDKDRQLEQWLLETGRPRLQSEILQIAERELQ